GTPASPQAGRSQEEKSTSEWRFWPPSPIRFETGCGARVRRRLRIYRFRYSCCATSPAVSPRSAAFSGTNSLVYGRAATWKAFLPPELTTEPSKETAPLITPCNG